MEFLQANLVPILITVLVIVVAAVLLGRKQGKKEEVITDPFERLRHACRYELYGSDCYSYGMMAKGRVDLVCEASMQPYDYAALIPIVEAAGGRMTDWSGAPLGLNGDGTVIAAGDPTLHAAAVTILGG